MRALSRTKTDREAGSRRRPTLSRCLVVSAASAVLIMAPRLAWGHPFDIYGFGSRAIAMGGAHGTLAEDFTATYYNPAALTRSQGLEFGMGYVSVLSDMEMNGESLNLSDAEYSGVQGGLSVSREFRGRRLAAGLGFELPDQAILATRLLDAFQPRFALSSDRTQRGKVLACIGLETLPWLSVGGGVAIAAGMEGSLGIQQTIVPERVKGRLVMDIRNTFFPLSGVLATPLEGLRIGATYRGEMNVHVGFEMNADIFIAQGTEPITASLGVTETHFFTPQHVVLGASYDVSSDLVVSLDLAWENWSARPREPIVSAVGGGTIARQPGFRDILVARTGAEYRLRAAERLDLAFRAGYVYQPSPVPPQTGIFNFLDSDKHTASAGIGIAFLDPYGILTRPMTLDIHMQYIRFMERTFRKTDPNDPIGDLTFGGQKLGVGAVFTFMH